VPRKIAGKIFFAVDPAFGQPQRRRLDRAPRNASGKVEFSSDFFLIKPKRIAKGRQRRALRVSIAAGRDAGVLQPRGRQPRPATPADMGDGFLMAQASRCCGSDIDPPQRQWSAIRRPGGAPIRGWSAATSSSPSESPITRSPIHDHAAYAVLDPPRRTTSDGARLGRGPRRIIRGTSGDSRAPRAPARPIDASTWPRSSAGKEIYEVIRRKNPPLVGLGPAAIRDVFRC
jgi:hypothetical protein